MDRSLYSVRPFVDADYDALARIGAALVPEFPATAD